MKPVHSLKLSVMKCPEVATLLYSFSTSYSPVPEYAFFIFEGYAVNLKITEMKYESGSPGMFILYGTVVHDKVCNAYLAKYHYFNMFLATLKSEGHVTFTGLEDEPL